MTDDIYSLKVKAEPVDPSSLSKEAGRIVELSSELTALLMAARTQEELDSFSDLLTGVIATTRTLSLDS